MAKVLLVDDHSILSDSLKYLIETSSDLEVVGTAINGSEAQRLCDELMPDVILMDIVMPVCDGIESTRLIKSKHGNIKILMLTTYGDEENLNKAMMNGADGYVLKDIKPDELILAVRSVLKGMSIMQKNVMDTMVGKISEMEKNTPSAAEIGLSEKELYIVRMLVGGKSNREIAEIMHYTEGSIKNSITVMLNRFKLKDRTQLAVFAVRNNLV